MGTGSNISVVLATYNGANFVSDQLRSIADQTIHPGELIIADDSSSDNTLDIVRQFADSAPFSVTILQNSRRLGYGANFLNAARRAKGTYLSFCDQDDVWLPTKLEISLKRLTDAQADLYVHGAIIIDSAGIETGEFDQSIRKKAVLEPLTLPPWGVFYGFSMFFRAELLGVIDSDLRGGHTFEFDGLLSHDLWIYFIAASLGTVVVDPIHLVKYRRHDKNQTPDSRGKLLKRLSVYLGIAAHKNLRRDLIAEHRSRILREFSSSSSQSGLRENALNASKYWSSIAQFEAIRINVYTQGRIIDRILLCIRLAYKGGYRSYRWGGLSWKLFLKDFLFGVLQINQRLAKR